MGGDIVRVKLDGTVATEHGEDDEDDEGSDNDPLLFCKEAHLCGTAIESRYYASSDNPRKNGRIAATYICCYCYTDGGGWGVVRKDTLAGKCCPPIC